MKYLYLCNTFARLMLQNIVLTPILHTYFKGNSLCYIYFLGYICRMEDGGRNMDVCRPGFRHAAAHRVKL